MWLVKPKAFFAYPKMMGSLSCFGTYFVVPFYPATSQPHDIHARHRVYAFGPVICE